MQVLTFKGATRTLMKTYVDIVVKEPSHTKPSRLYTIYEMSPNGLGLN